MGNGKVDGLYIFNLNCDDDKGGWEFFFCTEQAEV